MNSLPALAYKYHETLESFRTFRGVGRTLLIGTALAGVIFLGCFFRLIGTTTHSRGQVRPDTSALAIGSEVLFLILAFAVQQARDQEAVRRVNALLSGPVPATTNREARAALLSYLFAQPSTAFLGIADQVRRILELTRVGGRPFDFRAEKVWDFIYHPDARARITSLFLALATLLAGLTLLNAEVRAAAIEILVAGRPVWFRFWITFVIILTGAGAAFGALLSGGRALGEFLSRRSSRAHEFNPALVRYLLRDLATFHVWPGPPLSATESPKVAPIIGAQATMPTVPALPKPDSASLPVSIAAAS